MYILLTLIVVTFAAPDWTKVDQLMTAGIATRMFPGGVLMITNQTDIIYQNTYGYLTYRHDLY